MPVQALRGSFMPAADARATRHVRGTRRPEPRPVQGLRQPGAWPRLVRSWAFDSEALLLGGALLALCAWFALESSRGTRDGAAVTPLLSAGSAPIIRAGPPFAFVAREAKALIHPQLAQIPGAAQSAAGTSPVEQHALLAIPEFDPLGSVMVSGLPAETRLSAGTAVPGADANTVDWAVAFGDLDKLVVQLPRQRTGAIRATLDLRNRAGVKIKSLSVEVREAGGGGPPRSSAVDPPDPVSKSRVRPAKAVRPGSKSLRKTVRPQAKVSNAKPPVSSLGSTAKTAPAPKVVKVLPSNALPGGFFKPDPKDSASSGLPPALREDPRFTTLRGLGAGSIEPAAEPDGAAPP